MKRWTRRVGNYIVHHDSGADAVITSPIDPNDMVPGFLQPGQRVDVVASFTSGSDSVAKTILQNVPLLAVNANLAPVSSDEARKSAEASKSGGASTQTSAQPTVTLVTIAITPFEAERLVAAGQKGKLKIGLRGIGDDSRVETRGAGTNALMGIPAEQAPATPVRPTTLYRAPPVRPRRPYSRTTYVPPLLPILPPQAGGEPAHRTIRVIKGSKVENVEVDRSRGAALQPSSYYYGLCRKRSRRIRRTSLRWRPAQASCSSGTRDAECSMT